MKRTNEEMNNSDESQQEAPVTKCFITPAELMGRDVLLFNKAYVSGEAFSNPLPGDLEKLLYIANEIQVELRDKTCILAVLNDLCGKKYVYKLIKKCFGNNSDMYKLFESIEFEFHENSNKLRDQELVKNLSEDAINSQNYTFDRHGVENFLASVRAGDTRTPFNYTKWLSYDQDVIMIGDYNHYHTAGLLDKYVKQYNTRELYIRKVSGFDTVYAFPTHTYDYVLCYYSDQFCTILKDGMCNIIFVNGREFHSSLIDLCDNYIRNICDYRINHVYGFSIRRFQVGILTEDMVKPIMK